MTSKPTINRTATGTTTPMPALAPVDRPLSALDSPLVVGEGQVTDVEVAKDDGNHAGLLATEISVFHGGAAGVDTARLPRSDEGPPAMEVS